MMSRRLKMTGIILLVAVVIGAFYFSALRQRVRRLSEAAPSEEQIRREVVQPPLATPTDVRVKAKLFWASTISAATLEPVEMELPLSADPVQRSKQLLNALIAAASPEQRTLPPDAELAEFYLLPDGTAVADFSDTLATATPSGILSEQLAVDSIVKTLGANVPAVQRLKILIHGQEAETLAGHVDLTVIFPVRESAGPATPAQVAPGKTSRELTPPAAPGKLSH